MEGLDWAAVKAFVVMGGGVPVASSVAGRRRWGTRWLGLGVAAVLSTTGLAAVNVAASAATSNTLNLRILLIGDGNAAPETAAWESALSTEGVPYTEVDSAGTAPAETVTLPALSTGTTGYYNGVVITGSPTDFTAGQLTTLDTYESDFGVRQIDGYMFPNPALGATDVTSGALDGTTGTLNAAGLTAFPELAGPVSFDTGSFGYGATADTGAPFTSLMTESFPAAGTAPAGTYTLAGVYQHPGTDPQAGVSELTLFFDYNSLQTQWLEMAPGLINWVTQDTHLGLYRNYVEMDIDDTFTPDDAWSIANHTIDYADADALRMQPSDVPYAAAWSQANHFRMDQLFNYGSSAAAQAGDLEFAGSTVDSGSAGPDPLTAAFQATDPATQKPYTDDFGWISHTYDTPYLDVGCATTNYIEAELNENTSSINAAPGATAGTGGLGLAESDDTSLALGYEDPQVYVPGNHSGFADLVPGNPATVDPPDLDSSAANATGGTLAAGTYEYAVTDQFNGSDSPSTDQSSAFVTAPLTVSAGGSVTLTWESICHAANYLIYRSEAPYTSWSLVGNVATPTSATLPDNSSGDPASTTDVTGGGELEQTFTDTGAAGTPADFTSPPVQENAVEQPWEQNPYFVPAMEAAGITAVGDDASKTYPDPADATFGPGSPAGSPATYSGNTYAAGATWADGTAQVVPRHPINIYYNVSTEAQEVDEYNTLYLPPSLGGQCDTGTTVCLTAPATFQDIVNQVVSQMYQFMLSNNPEPSYVHQTNLLGSPPGCSTPTVCNAAPPATPPGTPDTTGDGTLYSVLNPLLAEYNADFNTTTTPYEQLTEGAIATVLAEQSAWQPLAAAATTDETGGQVTASVTNGTVTVSNSGTALNVPVTVPTGTTVNGTAFGTAYGGQSSDWVNVGTTPVVLTEPSAAPVITSGTTATSTVGTPFTYTITTTGTPTPTLTCTAPGSTTTACTLPAGLTFLDNGNGTATIAGTPATGSGASYQVQINANSSSGGAVQDLTLANDEAPTITSANTATFTTGVAGTYGITTTGYPAPTLALASGSPALPAGLSLTDNGNGTGTISGTPTAAGTTTVSIAATNAAGGATGSTATLSLTITVNAGSAPALSIPAADFTLNQAGSVTITTTGAPAPAITETGTVPGLTFTDLGNGTATLSGTPTTAGTTTLNVTAANGITPNATGTMTVVVGQAPTFTGGATATATATVGSAFTFTAATTGGSPTPVMTESGALPTGVTFTDNGNGTATLAGTPAAGTGGTYTVILTASNLYTTGVTQTLTLAVQQAPAITSANAATFTTGTLGTFTVTTTGSPNAALSESGALPSGVTFTDNGNGTATLAGTPASTATGNFPITITANNGVGTPAAQSLVLTVNAAPTAPAITSGNATTFTIGTQGSFGVTSTGSPTPAFTESGALPAGVTFADNGNGTATLAGTPAATDAPGPYTFTITAANGVGSNATQTFTLTVNPANAAPMITSAGSTTFAVGTAGTFAVTTTGYPTAKITATGAPSWATLTDNGNGTATLGGTPPAGSQGAYPVTITATNSVGTATQSFVLDVNSGLAITSAASATATSGTAFSFTVTTTGTPAPTLTHAGTLPSGITFTDNGNGTATLSGTAAASAKGPYPITFTAKNSTGTASQAFVLTVANPPAFSSAATATETAGTAFTFTVNTTGYPTAALTAAGAPAGVSFSDNGNGSGTLSGTTAVAAGSYPITFTAKNAGGTTTQSFTLTVNAAGTKVPVPTFTSAAAATATAGKAFTFTATTVGSPTTTYTTSVTHTGTLPAGLSFNNLGNGTATISGTPTAASGGTYPITLTAKNSAGTVTQSFVLTVQSAPTITSAASATATDGSSFNFTVKATGAPAPAMTESGTLPQGLTWVDNGNGTATLAGMPGLDQGGVYDLTFSASNSFGTTTQAFVLTVDQAPAITSASSATATHGKAFTFTFTATGYPVPNVTHTGSIAGLTYNNNGNGTATLSGTPRTAGTYTLTITAKDNNGTATQTWTLVVS
jgi:Putative Ig domain